MWPPCVEGGVSAGGLGRHHPMFVARVGGQAASHRSHPRNYQQVAAAEPFGLHSLFSNTEREDVQWWGVAPTRHHRQCCHMLLVNELAYVRVNSDGAGQSRRRALASDAPTATGRMHRPPLVPAGHCGALAMEMEPRGNGGEER